MPQKGLGPLARNMGRKKKKLTFVEYFNLIYYINYINVYSVRHRPDVLT